MEMQNQIKEYVAQYEKEVRKLADQLRNECMPQPTEELFSEFETNGNRMRYEAVYFGRRKFLAVLGLASVIWHEKEDIQKFRGSKYVQSVIGNSYKDAKIFLEEGKYVLFTGTPCQIEGLLKYLNKDYDKLYTQDIICHGVPSPKVWNKYLKYRQNIDNAKIENVEFRNKKYSNWENYEVCFKYEKEIYHVNHNKDSYMKAFLRDASLRDSCYACKFKSVNRASDVLLADFWGINNLMPDFNDKKGLNLLIVNTTKGENLIKNIDHLIEKRKVDVNQAIKYNKSCVESCKIPKMRETFFENINENNFEKVTEKFTVKSSKSFIKRALRKLKKIMLKK